MFNYLIMCFKLSLFIIFYRLLTDSSLQAIGEFCPALCSLNISNLCNLTDLGLCYLTDGCKSLESLNVTRAGFRYSSNDLGSKL